MLVIQVLCMLQSSSYRVLQKRWLGMQSTCDVDYPTIRKTCVEISQKSFICLCGIRKALLHTYAELVIMQFSTWLWDLMDFRWMEYWWRKFSKMCLSSRRLNVSSRYANRILWKSHPFRCVGVKCWYRHCALHNLSIVYQNRYWLSPIIHSGRRIPYDDTSSAKQSTKNLPNSNQSIVRFIT